jgi:hypothetical protein
MEYACMVRTFLCLSFFITDDDDRHQPSNLLTNRPDDGLSMEHLSAQPRPGTFAFVINLLLHCTCSCDLNILSPFMQP